MQIVLLPPPPPPLPVHTYVLWSSGAEEEFRSAPQHAASARGWNGCATSLTSLRCSAVNLFWSCSVMIGGQVRVNSQGYESVHARCRRPGELHSKAGARRGVLQRPAAAQPPPSLHLVQRYHCLALAGRGAGQFRGGGGAERACVPLSAKLGLMWELCKLQLQPACRTSEEAVQQPGPHTRPPTLYFSLRMKWEDQISTCEQAGEQLRLVATVGSSVQRADALNQASMPRKAALQQCPAGRRRPPERAQPCCARTVIIVCWLDAVSPSTTSSRLQGPVRVSGARSGEWRHPTPFCG